MTLVEATKDPQRRTALVAAARAEVDDEVASLNGMKGKAAQSAYAAVRRMRGDFIESNLELMLDRFAPVLDEHVAAGRADGDVNAYFASHDAEIAEDMLSVTDARADEAQNTAAKAVYARVRKPAKSMVCNSMDRVARFCDEHG